MTFSKNVEFKGHIFDSLLLPKILDTVLDNGAKCSIKHIEIGDEKQNDSYVRIKINAKSQEIIDNIINKLVKLGGKPLDIIIQRIEVKGHIIDSLTLPKILDIIINNGGRCNIEKIDIALEKNAFSYAKLKIRSSSQESMDAIIKEIQKHGALLCNK